MPTTIVDGQELHTVDLNWKEVWHTNCPQVSERKQTSLGLYVTAQEAYEMWQANQEQIKLLDVRTFEEYVLIGHAQMAMNVPLAFPTYNWDAGKGNYSVVTNADFIAPRAQED